MLLLIDFYIAFYIQKLMIDVIRIKKKIFASGFGYLITKSFITRCNIIIITNNVTFCNLVLFVQLIGIQYFLHVSK